MTHAHQTRLLRFPRRGGHRRRTGSPVGPATVIRFALRAAPRTLSAVPGHGDPLAATVNRDTRP